MKVNILCLVISILVLLSCRDKTSDVQDQSSPQFLAYTSNCVGPILWKADGITTDSMFAWTFGSKLIVDFSFLSNCCLDSTSFSISKSVEDDTITITVSDTVLSGCRCICTYLAHVELADLPNNHYVVQCVEGNIYHHGPPVHVVNVWRLR
jgi:hypothetical protein